MLSQDSQGPAGMMGQKIESQQKAVGSGEAAQMLITGGRENVQIHKYMLMGLALAG